VIWDYWPNASGYWMFRQGRTLFEGRREGRERRFEVGAEARDYRDDRERNPRSDEAVFNGRCG
jgi:hypothetical protein